MNQRTAKKIRREARRLWHEHLAAVAEWPLRERLRLAWYIVRAKEG